MRRLLVIAVAALGLLGSEGAAASIWPTSTRRLEADLVSSDLEVRRRAARRLGEVRGPGGKALVERALGDPDVEVRLAALEAGRALELEDFGARVAPWLSDPEPRIRLAAANVLALAPSPQAIGALARASSDTDPNVRSSVARALSASDSPEATLPLLGRLDDPVPDVRREVVAALGRLRDPRAVVPLLGKVEDTVPAVRQAVVRSLGELGDPRAVSALVLVLRDADEGVRVEALEALGRLGDKASTANVIAALGGATGATRRAAANALARLGTPEALAALVGELVREQPDDERATLVAAFRRAGKAALPALRECLVSRLAFSRVDGCAIAVGWLGDASDVPRLREALERGRLTPSAALATFARLGDPSAQSVVLERVTAPDPATRAAARAALGELLEPRRSDGRAVDPLLRALGARRIPLAERAELALLLGRTGSPRALEPLTALSGGGSPPALVAASLEGLGHLPEGVADTALVRGLDHEDGEVRRAAALAIRRAGSGRILATLLGRLERAAEQDRTALGLALPGPVARSRDARLVTRLERSMQSSRGAERDMLVDALAASPLAEAARGLVALARSADPVDRRKAAEGLAGRAEGRGALAALAADREASVRAAALWSLGSAGTKDDVPLLARGLADRDVMAAANAAAALGRVAARSRLDVSAALCGALDDERAYVRANVLRALGASSGRCAGSVARLLARDRVAVVRAAAAGYLVRSPGAPDRKALERCAAEDPSPSVAAVCATGLPAAPVATEAVLVYVVPAGELEAVPGAPFALELADGTYRLGLADRRGAVFERFAPQGEVELGIPGPLSE
ncbi:MAG TPA: HEAT repeat domain-containing protein [Polyangiaceae bacterium]